MKILGEERAWIIDTEHLGRREIAEQSRQLLQRLTGQRVRLT